MNKIFSLWISFAIVILLPLFAFASQDQEKLSVPDSKPAPSAKMSSRGGMAILGQDLQKGIRLMAHLVELEAVGAKSGGQATHQIMIILVNESSGGPIALGAASVKVESREGEDVDEANLERKNGHLVADLSLQKPGQYVFTIYGLTKDEKELEFSLEATVEPFKK